MVNWLDPMDQSYEYYIVDPNTWKDIKRIDTVIDSTISRDLTVPTLGSVSLTLNGFMDENYIRIYLITIQNGIRERHPLGTFLIQTHSSSYNGKYEKIPVDGYTPLIELTENKPDLGFSLLKDENIMDNVYLLTRDNVRAPVIKTNSEMNLYSDFVANGDDDWLSFNSDLMANAKYSYGLDEISRILFIPDQDTASLQPVWTYNDDNSSILYDDITIEKDIFGIPNVVEVTYSSGEEYFYSLVENNDENSPTSIPRRGRRILHRITNPNFGAQPSQAMVDEYAQRSLTELSILEYKVVYKHGYCPVRLGDCVRLNYTRSELRNVKAKVISQSISCISGCPVSETVVFTKKFYR